jgi:hypothetical protein
MLDRILTIALWPAAIGLAVFLLIAAGQAVAMAYRWVRFHCGRVPDDGRPLNQDEARALLDIRRKYGKWTQEPDKREREDWT